MRKHALLIALIAFFHQAVQFLKKLSKHTAQK